MAKEGSSAKFGVAVFKASILNFLGVPLAKVGSSIAKVLCSGIQGISALVLGCPLAKVGSSAKFCVVVFKASHWPHLPLKASTWGFHWPK